MARPLRELFAEFKIKIDGSALVTRANKALDKTKSATESAKRNWDRFVKVYKAIEKVIDTVQKLVNVLNILKGLSGLNFGRNIERQSRIASASVNRASSSISRFGSLIGGSFLIAGIQRFISNLITMGDEVDKVSQQVGLTVRQYQAFSHAAALGGVNSQEFTNALGQLQRRANDAASGSAESAEAFRQLGVDVKDANGELLDGEELFLRVAEGLNNTSNSSVRTALSMELMGRNGRKLLPMFKDGRRGIERMKKELDELGGGLSEEGVQNSANLADALQRMKVSFTSVSNSIAVQFLPQLEWLTQKATTLIVAFSKITKNSELVKAAIITLTGAIVAFGISTLPATWPFILMAAALVAIMLLIDDFLVAIKGGDSVLEGWVNSLGEMFGVTELGTRLFATIGRAVEKVRKEMARGETFTEALRRAFANLWASDSAVDNFVSVIIAVIGTVIDIISSIPGVLASVWNFMKGVLRRMIDGWHMFKSMFQNIIFSIIMVFLNFQGRVGAIIQAVTNAIRSVRSLVTGAVNTVTSNPYVSRLIGSAPAPPPVPTGGTQTVATNRGRGNNINAGMQVNVGTINAATDIDAVRREIGNATREATERQVRELQGALVAS